jgi:hypothetical protein
MNSNRGFKTAAGTVREGNYRHLADLYSVVIHTRDHMKQY